MSTPEKKPTGPWGQNNQKVDEAGRKADEARQRAADEKSAAIVKVTNDLREQVRVGDENEAQKAFDIAISPPTVVKFDSSVVSGFVMTVLEETGKKHGWSTIDKILDNPLLEPQSTEAIKEALRQRDTGWKK